MWRKETKASLTRALIEVHAKHVFILLFRMILLPGRFVCLLNIDPISLPVRSTIRRNWIPVSFAVRLPSWNAFGWGTHGEALGSIGVRITRVEAGSTNWGTHIDKKSGTPNRIFFGSTLTIMKHCIEILLLHRITALKFLSVVQSEKSCTYCFRNAACFKTRNVSQAIFSHFKLTLISLVTLLVFAISLLHNQNRHTKFV